MQKPGVVQAGGPVGVQGGQMLLPQFEGFQNKPPALHPLPQAQVHVSHFIEQDSTSRRSFLERVWICHAAGPAFDNVQRLGW